MKQSSFSSALLQTLPLTIMLLIAVLLISLVVAMTEEPIKQVETERHYRFIRSVMPLDYDNDMVTDMLEINAVGDLGTDQAVPFYRARKQGKPVGLVLLPVAADGYNGPIKLALGIDYEGNVLGVKIMEHSETTGFGELIHQDKSNWLMTFRGKSLNKLPKDEWYISSDGGSIDGVSGASISSAAVMKAIANSLAYYRRIRDSLY